jgi:O-antigen/teichoic acid export membrane protein
LIAHRAERFLTGSAVTALIVNVGLNLAVIPRYGALGAAVTTVVTECAVLTANLFFLSRMESWHLPKANGRIIAAVIALAVFCALWSTSNITQQSLALVILAAGMVLAPIRRTDLAHLGLRSGFSQ